MKYIKYTLLFVFIFSFFQIKSVGATCTGEILTNLDDAKVCAMKTVDEGRGRGFNIFCSVDTVTSPAPDPNTGLAQYYSPICTVIYNGHSLTGIGAYLLSGFDAASGSTALVQHVNAGWDVLQTELANPYQVNACPPLCNTTRIASPPGGTNGFDPFAPFDASGGKTMPAPTPGSPVPVVDPALVAAQQHRASDYTRATISSGVTSLLNGYKNTSTYFLKDYENRVQEFNNLNYTPETNATPASSCPLGGFTDSERQMLIQYFTGGQHVSDIPKSFNLDSAFAFFLGMGNTGASHMGADKGLYSNQNGKWVLLGIRPPSTTPIVPTPIVPTPVVTPPTVNPGNSETPPAYLYAMDNYATTDNAARERANLVIIANARAKYNYDVCNYNYSLLQNPGTANTCATQFPQVAVPGAPGVLQVPILNGGQVLAPVIGQTPVVCATISLCPSSGSSSTPGPVPQPAPVSTEGPSQAMLNLIEKARVTAWTCTAPVTTPPTPTPTGSSCPLLTMPLSNGSIGGQVSILTDFLAKHGYLPQSTNIFDESVFTAVVSYQEDNATAILAPLGLTSGTGIVGPSTRNFINPQLTCSTSTPPVVTPPSPTVTNTIPGSFRYLRIDTTKNGWVSWREIEVYDNTGAKITPVGISASKTYDGNWDYPPISPRIPPYAIDGDSTTYWSAGETDPRCTEGFYPPVCKTSSKSAWIIVDLGSVKSVSKIRLQSASTGLTESDVISTSVDGKTFGTVTTLNGPYNDSQWVEYGTGAVTPPIFPGPIVPILPVVISSIAPASGPIGTQVTLTGISFSPTGNTIKFDSYSFFDVSASNNTLQFTVLPQVWNNCRTGDLACLQAGAQPSIVLPGQHNITVTNSIGISSVPSTFTVTSSAQPGPILPTGTLDILSYMLKTDPSNGLKSSDPNEHGTFHQVVNGTNFYLEKWRSAGQIVHYSYDDNYIYMTDDSTAVYPYKFNPPAVWAKRYMKVGDVVSGSQATIDEFNSSCVLTASKRAWPYQVTLSAYYPADTDWGGDLGKREAIVLSYSWGSTVEKEYYAKGYGLFKWQSFGADGTKSAEAILNVISNTAPVQPDPICFDLQGNLKTSPGGTVFSSAVLVSPSTSAALIPGSTLPDLTTVNPTFSWTGGSSAYGYWMVISDASGNTINSGEVIPANTKSKTIVYPQLPSNGSQLNVRLYTLQSQSDRSHYVDYKVKAPSN